MVYPQHWLFVMGGTITTDTNTEVWQCGIRGLFDVDPSSAQADAWLAATATAMPAWYSAAASCLRQDSQITYVKVNEIGPNGRYVDPTNPHTKAVATTNGGLAPRVPSFVMTAWSWKTGQRAGPASNGRIYPPNTPGNSYSYGADRITTADAQAHVAAAKSLLTLLATTRTAHTFTPNVVSDKGTGLAAPIGAIRVGDVLDVQRRRKDKLRENYSSATFP